MKKIYLLLLFTGVVAFSQEFKIPEINLTEKDTINYITLLNITDPDALIVKLQYESYWSGGVISNFIVYQHDGTVMKYAMFVPQEGETVIKQERLKKKQYTVYQKALAGCIAQNMLDIDSSKLNIQHKRTADAVEVISIDDATLEEFVLWQKGYKMSFASYAAAMYIAEEVEGAEERQKFVNLMKHFETVWDAK